MVQWKGNTLRKLSGNFEPPIDKLSHLPLYIVTLKFSVISPQKYSSDLGFCPDSVYPKKYIKETCSVSRFEQVFLYVIIIPYKSELRFIARSLIYNIYKYIIIYGSVMPVI
jgi:hypothetical protein